MKIPSHIAFIMDGNGRWASARGLKRLQGHTQGVETVKTVIKEGINLGINSLSFYAFSTENWNRSTEEVSGLMGLLKHYFASEIDSINEQGIRVCVWGDLQRNPAQKLPVEIIQLLEDIQDKTKNNTKIRVNFCINYGARDEIIRAAQGFAADVEDGLRFVGDLDEDLFRFYLDSKTQSAPDLMIRTGGEKRLSNFLLWQLAYSELYFTDTAWPDFSVEDFHLAIEEFNNRERRYGKVGESITA